MHTYIGMYKWFCEKSFVGIYQDYKLLCFISTKQENISASINGVPYKLSCIKTNDRREIRVNGKVTQYYMKI